MRKILFTKILFIKAIWIIAIVSACVTTLSCSDEDEGLELQDHDSNKMMALMHAMGDSMKMMQMTMDPDNDFAMMMKSHHKGAINMANIELKEGKDSSLHQLARKMITAQTKEIASLDSFLKVHPATVNNPLFHQKGDSVMAKMGRNADLQIITGNIDRDFATLMIQHHQAATEMADLEIHYGKDAKLIAIARKMIDDQEMEIRELQNWLLE